MARKEGRCLYSYLKTYRDNLSKKKQLKRNKLASKLFKLNVINIKNILDNQIMPRYPGITYKVNKAISTDSYYVMFFYDDIYVTTRLSDHESKIGAKGLIITEKTTKQDIKELFEQRIIDLKAKYKGYAFTNFKKLISEKEEIIK